MIFNFSFRYLFPIVALCLLYKKGLCLDNPKPSIYESFIEGLDTTPNQIVGKDSFDFGQDFYVDDILEEMIRMGLRPKPGSTRCLDSTSCNGTSRSQGETSKTEAVEQVVQFSLDYTDERDHSVQPRSVDDVSDILEEPVKGERQARLFYNFDRGSAFNTSVAFTIPLFSFTLPGAGDVTGDGFDGNVFGTMAFVSLFLLGGLGVAIYTTTQGAVGPDGADEGRSMHNNKAGADDLSLIASVFAGLSEMSSALDLPSCSYLAVCEAYQHPEHYGFMAYPFKIWAPLRPESPESDLAPHESAARFATEGGDCNKKFSCLVDPIEALDLLYQTALSNIL